MMDVEKYGLVALVFVLGILGLIVVYDGDEDAAPSLTAETARPVLMQPEDGNLPQVLASDGRLPASRSVQPSTHAAGKPASGYKVASPVAGRGAFAFDEPPVSYPGARSVGDLTGDGVQLHTVRPQETLSDIAKTYLGSSARWRDILLANPGLEPRRMQVGDTIRIPDMGLSGSVATATAAAPLPAAAASAPRTYTVRNGDTLGGIAQKTLGSAIHSEKIFQANRDVLPHPDKLKVGLKLRIP